ncbi:MAG: thiol peroxidase [Lentisphaerae bacterium]|nr:thiol peroxidase [Lentisphaerota bacterium]
MATITLKGNSIHTVGELPAVGRPAPDFTLTSGKLEDVTLATFAGRKKILNIVPSLDTSTCAMSARQFNQQAAALPDTVVLCISADLPFAQGRFCSAEKIQNVTPLSSFRSPRFGKDYGVEITDGPIRGLLSRAIVVLDAGNRVLYTQQVGEIADEPDYAAALQAARTA